MKQIVIFLLLVSGLLADRDGGPYVGIGYGLSTFNDDGLYSSMSQRVSQSLSFYGGAYINKHLSVELKHSNFANWYRDSAKTDSISLSATSLSTLAHYAFLDDTLDLYAKFGVARMHFSIAQGSGFGMLFGAGAGYRLNDMLTLLVGYDFYQFDYDANSNNITDYKMSSGYLFSALEIQF